MLSAALDLCGCTRTGAPQPTSDTAAEPVLAPSSPPPASVGGDAASASAAVAGSAAPAAPIASTAPVVRSPDPWTMPQDCSKLEVTEARRARAVATCSAKEDFRAFVAARQSCASANECAIVLGSCPFGCFVPVAKSATAAVTAKLVELGARLEQAGERCVYRCMSPPTAACVEGRCTSARGEPAGAAPADK